jgi:hypothetical protein
MGGGAIGRIAASQVANVPDGRHLGALYSVKKSEEIGAEWQREAGSRKYVLRNLMPAVQVEA